MFIYKDILEKLKCAGYSTYRIRKDKLLPESALQRIRKGKPIELESLDKICSLLNCRIEDVIEYRKGDKLESDRKKENPPER